jgi:NNP family nitrate/nitrite transporter-like MFS transporter
MPAHISSPTDRSAGQLALGTISFTLCFAAWGLISAFAPHFRSVMGLSASHTALLVAVPVLLGSLARIPAGMLTDRLGARPVFTVLFLLVAGATVLVQRAGSYEALLAAGFFLGLAGSSFAVGVGHVSRWFPADRQGSALGVYGLGNIGQSAAVFLGPAIASVAGIDSVFHGATVLLVAWAVVFFLLAREAPRKSTPARFSRMVSVLMRERLAWVLALFYFLTFGGFVAFSIYLPTLLRDQFGLSPTDAGFRAAGFVVLATALRPVGGWLADNIGGARVLSGVFGGAVPFALLLCWPAMLPFTVGALGCAALLGIGNGAVFKLVPQYFPAETGTVTGLVGATGGMGGFFPPLLLGFSRDRIGAIWPGFVLLAATAAGLWWTNRRVFLQRQRALELAWPAEFTRTADRLRAAAWATMWTGLLVAAIVVGSRNLQNFDPALVIYTFAVIFATWGVVYHYSVWLDKPPTRVYWERGRQIFLQRGVLRSLVRMVSLASTYLAAQGFIRRRSTLRWWMHQLIFWGCILAVLITFPLVFGWISFETLPDDQMAYVTLLYGVPVASFRVRSFVSDLLFHALNISAFMVIAGVFLSLWRRMQDKGAQTLQSFATDFFPIILLFAISVTGLALTASQLWLRGEFYSFLAIVHAITVVAALLYLPFGKFFHIFQRPAQLGVKLYHDVGDAGEGAACVRCGARFASRLHVDDLMRVLPQLGFDYTMPGPAGNWQELCPACKRKSISMAQLRLKEESRG